MGLRRPMSAAVYAPYSVGTCGPHFLGRTQQTGGFSPSLTPDAARGFMPAATITFADAGSVPRLTPLLPPRPTLFLSSGRPVPFFLPLPTDWRAGRSFCQVSASTS